ncbi:MULTISPECIES: hypothetical protein [unclassified Endozoicomonas]|uniref:hypothetical protein n=1 Tax=unclassified Endozoicomonas TaxID=2644528 RepID=UPI003BB6F402
MKTKQNKKLTLKESCFFSLTPILIFSLILTFSPLTWAEANLKNNCYITIDGEVDPVLVLLVLSYKEKGVDDKLIIKRISNAINDGCDLNVTDKDGLSPLNTSILFQHLDLVEFFIEKGATPYNKIISPKDVINGLDSVAFSKALLDKDWSDKRQKIYDYLKK